jgi:hypothetical protein
VAPPLGRRRLTPFAGRSKRDERYFRLPYDYWTAEQRWYRQVMVKKAPQAPLGIAQEYHHTLLPPFTQRRAVATVTKLRTVS